MGLLAIANNHDNALNIGIMLWTQVWTHLELNLGKTRWCEFFNSHACDQGRIQEFLWGGTLFLEFVLPERSEERERSEQPSGVLEIEGLSEQYVAILNTNLGHFPGSPEGTCKFLYN